MSADRLAVPGLLAAMAVVAALAWWLELRPDLRVDAARLETLPLALDGWRGVPVPLRSTVERILDADLNLQRAYESPDTSETVWLYVGYYGTHRGGRPEHTPGVCYPSAGWTIEASREWTAEPRPDGDGRARLDAPHRRVDELVVSRGGERRLVHFWYRSGRRTGLLGTWSVSVDQLRGRLADGRADGALVRLSTPIAGGGIEAARRRLAAFRRVLEPELEARWPTEHPRS